MNPLFLFQAGVNIATGLVVTLFLIRQLLVILAAEQGRKHDLVKKSYRRGQELQLSILVPFLDPNVHPALLQLLHAIHEQDYPASKITVHLVTSEESARDLIPQSLRPNVKVWRHPESMPRYEQAVSWLIERCLALGGNGMFVFLKPSDIVKNDFLQNIAAKGLDSFVLQGYVALKNQPQNLVSQVLALSNRIFNRINNAGRYHLGMSCRLLDSGWAIKQEVLEMIPYHRGQDLDNLEYTIRLNLQNFRVNWAPSAVVYADSHTNALDHFTLCAGAFLNRLGLLFHYGPSLVTRLLMRFDLNYFEQLVAIVNLPYLMTFLALTLFTVLDAKAILPLPGTPLIWGVAAALTLLLNVMALVVARCKSNDYATMFVFTPMAYLMGAVLSPFALFGHIRQSLNQRPTRGASYRKARRTRFNEDLDTPPSLFEEDRPNRQFVQHVLNDSAPIEKPHPVEFKQNKADQPSSRKTRRGLSLVKTASHESNHDSIETTLETLDPSRASQSREAVKTVPLSNGVNQVSCRLKTLTTINDAGQESYRLTLEYKTLSFSTESYRILDQAFYELHAKLVSRGLTIVTCGSCGNFYNPTADVPGALKNAGVCLFDKIGKEVNLNTDAVTVISQACDYHCPLDQRENIVRQWKDSLTFSSRSQ